MMTLRMTLVAVPQEIDGETGARSPRFPGRQRLDLLPASLPERVRVRLAEADEVIHAPEVVLGSDAPKARPEAALAEVELGRWAGRAMAEVADAEAEAFALWRTDMAFAPAGGEALLAARVRVGRWLSSLEGRSGRLVALCPMTVARLLLTAALDAPLTLAWRLDVMAWSATELTRHRNRWAMRLP